ncbi:MAG: PTS sugar transporter subunit IIB [Solobacterium sp.]|nr:PTS sugar transporter subunit IIB [Solobacterium sp.]
MKKVLFLCAAGMSTSLLVNKTMEAVHKLGKEDELVFTASEVSNAAEAVPGNDCVLLAPQVRYKLNDLKKQFPDLKIELIPPQVYGMCNGPEIIKQAEKLLKL